MDSDSSSDVDVVLAIAYYLHEKQ